MNFFFRFHLELLKDIREIIAAYFLVSKYLGTFSSVDTVLCVGDTDEQDKALALEDFLVRK